MGKEKGKRGENAGEGRGTGINFPLMSIFPTRKLFKDWKKREGRRETFS